jgi:predicted phosphodiesterase
MLVAALYDIHGNLPALEAVLQEIRRLGVGRVVVGGDVLPGPMPRETLRCLLNLDIPVEFICGNGEVAVLEARAGRHPASVQEQHRPLIDWTAQQLSPEEEHVLTSWPKTLQIEIPGLGDVLFCHATPRNENEIFTRLTADERLVPVFAGLKVRLVVCGHTHMQFDRRIGGIRVVNAGSVGMPFGEAGADWLLLGQRGWMHAEMQESHSPALGSAHLTPRPTCASSLKGPAVQLRHTRYDLAKAAGQIRATGYPQAQDFAAHNVLQPPSEAKMLELFTSAELK